MTKGSGTRSGLLWEVERLLLECKELGELPQVLVMENVAAIHNKKNLPDFQKWLDCLEDMGYKTYWQDLNSKNYGVPQNRDRCFAISVLSNNPYVFPKPIELTRRLKHVLEDSVSENFYINNEKAEKLIVELINKGVLETTDDKTRTAHLNYNTIDKIDVNIAKTLCARDYKGFGTGWDTMNGVIEED